MIAVKYYKVARCPFSRTLVENTVKQAARQEKKIKGTVEIVVVSEPEIKKLNYEHRGINAPTDVLSFPWNDESGGSPLLGQLYLCYPYIARQAKRFVVPVEEEFTRMITHGLLHLVGYDHVKEKEAERMFSKQEEIVSTILNA